MEDSFSWEPDPLYFIFNSEIPGKVRMHTKRLDMVDWIKIDKTYPAQMKLKEELIKTKKDQVFVSNPDDSTTQAKQELLMMIMEHLVQHHPDKFEKQDSGLLNKITQQLVSLDGDDPLIQAGDENYYMLEPAKLSLQIKSSKKSYFLFQVN